MIIVQNIDSLFSYLSDDKNPKETNHIYAVPNFRNKKKCYSVGGNFNAGLMVVPHPGRADYDEMMHMLNKGYNDTEEKLFNEIYRGRYIPLEFGFNSQKRCFSFNPALWDEVVDSENGIRVIHYVGYKPWQSAAELCRLDWEFAGVDKSSAESMDAGCATICAPYKPVTDLWHVVRRSAVHDEESAALYLSTQRRSGALKGPCIVNMPSAVEFFKRSSARRNIDDNASIMQSGNKRPLSPVVVSVAKSNPDLSPI
jgi:lipopolysaccharide biosynthesis glycosyltransferase